MNSMSVSTLSSHFKFRCWHFHRRFELDFISFLDWYTGLPGNGCLSHSFVGTSLRMFESRLPLVWCALWCRQILRICPVRRCYLYSCQPLSSTGQVCDIELRFSLEGLSFSSLPVSPRQCNVLFSLECCSVTPHKHALIQISILPLPFQAEGKSPFNFWQPVLFRVGWTVNLLC